MGRLPVNFGDATPTPWADPVPVDFGSLSRLTRIQSGVPAEYAGSSEPKTPVEQKADIGRSLLRGAYGPTFNEDLVKISDVPIKNTFIDGLPDEESEQPSIMKTRSAPNVFGARARSLLYSSPASTRQNLEIQQSSILQVQPNTVATVIQAATQPAMVTVAAADGSPSSQLPSVGSSLHGTGQCRPCAWFHKPQGCARGWECRHCHACGPDELRNRKKDKVAVLRAQEKAEKMVQQVQTGKVVHIAPIQCSRPLALSHLV